MNILLKNEFLFITKQGILIFLDKLSKVIKVKKVLTKFILLRSSKTGFSLTRNDGLSEYCENIFTNELRILNGVVFLPTFFTKKVVVFWFFFSTKKNE